jgi:hypothetical protein
VCKRVKLEVDNDIDFWLLLLCPAAETLLDECDLYANECVPLKDCTVLNTLLLGADSLITPDVAEKLEKSKCLNSTKVCCPKMATASGDEIEVDIGSRFGENFAL